VASLRFADFAIGTRVTASCDAGETKSFVSSRGVLWTTWRSESFNEDNDYCKHSDCHGFCLQQNPRNDRIKLIYGRGEVPSPGPGSREPLWFPDLGFWHAQGRGYAIRENPDARRILFIMGF